MSGQVSQIPFKHNSFTRVKRIAGIGISKVLTCYVSCIKFCYPKFWKQLYFEYTHICLLMDLIKHLVNVISVNATRKWSTLIVFVLTVRIVPVWWFQYILQWRETAIDIEIKHKNTYSKYENSFTLWYVCIFIFEVIRWLKIIFCVYKLKKVTSLFSVVMINYLRFLK